MSRTRPKRSPERKAWHNMKSRCLNSNYIGYSRYGGRGVGVCKRWRDSFRAFLEDVGPRPSANHSLGRIDNDGDYEPGNVRWETREEQNDNKSNTVYVTYEGQRCCLAKLARSHGLDPNLVSTRVVKCGWSVERAITERPRRRKGRRLIAHAGLTLSVREWAELTGVSHFTLYSRLSRGWPIAKALDYWEPPTDTVTQDVETHRVEVELDQAHAVQLDLFP